MFQLPKFKFIQITLRSWIKLFNYSDATNIDVFTTTATTYTPIVTSSPGTLYFLLVEHFSIYLHSWN